MSLFYPPTSLCFAGVNTAAQAAASAGFALVNFGGAGGCVGVLPSRGLHPAAGSQLEPGWSPLWGGCEGPGQRGSTPGSRCKTQPYTAASLALRDVGISKHCAFFKRLAGKKCSRLENAGI